MELKERDLIIDSSVINFFKDVDCLIGNFEGTITQEERIFMDQRHKNQILDALSSLFKPERTCLSNANNHSGDFGKKIFQQSLQVIEQEGFQIFGTLETPFIDLNDKVRIIGSSMWSNRKCNYLVNFYDSTNYFDQGRFNISYPHWGYELYMYPDKKLVKIAHDHIEKFDAVIGHHSHIPQPITITSFNNSKKLLAYSLGDFSYGDNFPKKNLHHYKHGIILKCEMGLDVNRTIKIGKVDWEFVTSDPVDQDTFKTSIQNNLGKYDKHVDFTS